MLALMRRMVDGRPAGWREPPEMRRERGSSIPADYLSPECRPVTTLCKSENVLHGCSHFGTLPAAAASVSTRAMSLKLAASAAAIALSLVPDLSA